MRGADVSVCGMRMNSAETYVAAAIGRPDMPHTLRYRHTGAAAP